MKGKNLDLSVFNNEPAVHSIGESGKRLRCPICNKPRSIKDPHTLNQTCGGAECLRRLKERRSFEQHSGWPEQTGEIAFSPNAFANNVTTRQNGTCPMRPATQVDTISPTALLLREAPPG